MLIIEFFGFEGEGKRSLIILGGESSKNGDGLKVDYCVGLKNEITSVAEVEPVDIDVSLINLALLPIGQLLSHKTHRISPILANWGFALCFQMHHYLKFV